MSRIGIPVLVGVLCVFASVPSGPSLGQPSPDAGAVVINEIMYAPPSSSNEFIELYNRSDAPVDLSHLEYADGNRNFSPVASTSSPLQPGHYAVLVRDTAAFGSAFPSVPSHAPTGWDALNNGGDTVILRHAASGTVLDALSFSPSWGGDEGHSLERIDPAGPANTASNFGSSTAEKGATPRQRNSIYHPDTSPPQPIFAEMTTDTNVEMTFSEPLSPASIQPSAFLLPSTRIETATLTSNATVALSVSAPPTTPTLQVVHIQDRVGNELQEASLPLARQPEQGDVIVNEILFAPRTDEFDNRPNQVEYVELRNQTDHALTLNGLVLTDRPNEDGVADTLRVGKRASLRSHGHAVIAASPNEADSPSASQLATAFPNAPLDADTVAVLLPEVARLGLGNDGGLVRLHRADGDRLAEVQYSPDWHTPALEVPKGTALERISPSGNAESADNWTSSPSAAGGTPGTRNAISQPAPPSSPESSLQITPSPFSIERDGATRIRYSLNTVPTVVRARIYDARGRKVRTLEDARLAAQTGELVWNGRTDAGNRVRVGVYVVLFEALQPQQATEIQLKAPVVVARPLD